ncbi:secretin N-terminal domain-containing protein [Gimesia fumaroli]|uniref:Type IV pilus biogenesis and competence protein PilQ n=1 Tax=Gimesia fumaroli TaxID=2527976 RepID=A0A518ILT0_9PLAN|nr:secretin N-terminal domain-containing protein [Gimesia fumaroli]QDV54049.1 Type IV pilus biogenesis and competence protein PilQ precursor [Gimesia fumaroli]
MKRQFFIPAFWATLTGLSLLLIAAMTNISTPESLFISPHHQTISQPGNSSESQDRNSQPVVLKQPSLREAEPQSTEHGASKTVQQQPVVRESAMLSATAEAKTKSPQNKPIRSRILFEPGIEISSESKTKPNRAIQFNLASEPELPIENQRSSKMEMRLASLTKQVDRLTNLQMQSQQQSNLELAQNTNRLEQATKLLQQMQQTNQLRDLEKKLDSLQNKQTEPAAEKAKEPVKTETSQTESVETEKSRTKHPVLKVSPNKDSSETFSLQIQDAEIMQVLDMLGELSGTNILTGQGVAGTITANLKNVTPAQALEAILRSRDLTSEKEGEFIYVMTQAQMEQKKKSNRKVVTKLFTPFYVSAKELQTLITPILTENIGVVSLTTPSEVGISPDPTSAGGDAFAQTDAILVRDYPEVLEEVDRLLETMDVPPMQVVIEAMIISVRLSDDMRFGVNFAMLSGDNKNLIVDGNGRVLNNASGFPGSGSSSIVPPTGQFLADVAGLKYGFLHGDISGFIEALEDITETNLIASPQLRALNKQKAELIIGDRISYSTVTQNGTTSIQNVNFLDSGIVLNMRPFITPDGQIRMEIHPERSSATINPRTELPDLQTTEVTTNVMVHDGHTVVIGGLIEERASDAKNQVPFLGAIPVIGNAFRQKREILERTELIVLITPRIVRPEIAQAEGETLEYQEAERLDAFKKNFLPINQVRIVQAQIKQAKKYLRIGNLPKAKHHIKIAVRLDKNNIEAIQLQKYINEALINRNRSMIGLPPTSAPGMHVPTLEGNQ